MDSEAGMSLCQLSLTLCPHAFGVGTKIHTLSVAKDIGPSHLMPVCPDSQAELFATTPLGCALDSCGDAPLCPNPTALQSSSIAILMKLPRLTGLKYSP